MYDAQLGRFHTQDRFAEKYLDFTPYQYGANNPILNIDINGDSIWTTANSHRDKNGNLYINRTINITGKVYNATEGNVSLAGKLASSLNARLNSQSGTETITNADGTKVITTTSINANYEGVSSMDDVGKTDHLVVIVDNVTGQADSKLGGGDALGKAPIGGQVAYVEAGGGMAETTNRAFHEVGHNLGLKHPETNSANNPMSYSGRNANFSVGQLNTAVGSRHNVGSNSTVMRKIFPATKAGTWGASTQNRPYNIAPAQNKRIPIPIK